jgi:hypothetical protein
LREICNKNSIRYIKFLPAKDKMIPATSLWLYWEMRFPLQAYPAKFFCKQCLAAFAQHLWGHPDFAAA